MPFSLALSAPSTSLDAYQGAIVLITTELALGSADSQRRGWARCRSGYHSCGHSYSANTWGILNGILLLLLTLLGHFL
jgi:hypothetical protein